MSQQIGLRQAEQKVFGSAFRDGLWDILIGCVILVFAIAPFLSPSLGDLGSSVVFLPFWALAFLVTWWIRRRVVHPRIGVVKFGSWRRARLSRLAVVMLIVNVIAFVLGILSALSFRAVPGWVHIASFSLIALAAFSATATFMGFTWLYIYGLLIALSPLVGEWLYVHLNVPHHGFPVTFGISAGVPMLVGLVKLIRLVRDYPVSSQEGHPEEMLSG
jgi:Na+-driven multidrug efflux pump